MNHLANGRQKHPDMRRSEPGRLDKLNWLIHLQHVTGENVGCRESIQREIAKSKGKNEFAYFKQGMILREERRFQEALDAFQMCMKLNCENARNFEEVGRCLYEMGRYRLALESYFEAEKVSHCPDCDTYSNIGQCLMNLGEVSKAKEYAQKAVQLGRHETAYLLLIRILTSEGEFKNAVSVSNAAVESCPDSVNVLTESGQLYLKMGETQQAFEKFSSALALDPNCARALLGIGCITQSHEECDVALTKYKTAVSHQPNSIALWNNIGLCFRSKQKHVAAISCLKRALWLSPTNWRVLFNLGLVHLSTHQSASAFNFMCAAVNLRPDVAHSFIGLGCALFHLNDMENGQRAFRQALGLAPHDPGVLLNNALCFSLKGCKEEALELFLKFQMLVEENVIVCKEVTEFAEKVKHLLNVPSEQSDNGIKETPSAHIFQGELTSDEV